jgi:hypothetical protein
VPVALLKVGANTLQFSVEDDGDETSDQPTGVITAAPLALKNVFFQFDYGKITPAAAPASSTPTSFPTEALPQPTPSQTPTPSP